MSYKDFSDITVTTYNDNITLIYGLLEYNLSENFTCAVLYMRMFNATKFWNNIEPTWTSQTKIFILGGSEQDSRIARDFSAITYNGELYISMFYSYYNTSSGKTEYYSYVLDTRPPLGVVENYSLSLKEAILKGSFFEIITYTASDWSRLSNAFLLNDSLYFVIMMLKD